MEAASRGADPGRKNKIKQLMNEGVDVFVNLCDGTPDDALSGIALVKALEKYNAAFTGCRFELFTPPAMK